MIVEFLPEARSELLDALAYYEKESAWGNVYGMRWINTSPGLLIIRKSQDSARAVIGE